MDRKVLIRLKSETQIGTKFEACFRVRAALEDDSKKDENNEANKRFHKTRNSPIIWDCVDFFGGVDGDDGLSLALELS